MSEIYSSRLRFKSFNYLCLIILLALPQLWSGRAQAGVIRHITVDDALHIMKSQSPRLRAAYAQVDAAGDRKLSQGGRLLPAVVLSDEEQFYQEAFLVTLFPGEAPLTARGLSTNTFIAIATQPLLGLLRLSCEYAAMQAVAGATARDAKALSQQVFARIKTTFLELFETRALVEIADASEHTLADQLTVANAKAAAGSYTRADVLRIEVAVANAKQQRIMAQGQQESQTAALLELLGLGEEADHIEFVEPVTTQVTAHLIELSQAKQQALHQRAEIESAHLQAKAAQNRADAKLFALLPEVDLEGAYMHVTGQAFAPTDAAYVGIKAQWPVWSWGSQVFEQRAAAEEARAAQATLEDTRRSIAAEVAARRAEAIAAASAVEVTQLALTSAQEAYRVMQALIDNGSATTTDLLDAESALTRARLNLVRAKYQAALTSVAFELVLGQEQFL